MIVEGRRYHFRKCVKCGNTFYTIARYSHPALCKECSHGVNILSLSKEEMDLLREIRNDKKAR